MSEPALITVRVYEAIYSSVPGRTGNWTMTKVMRLAAVPRPGDDIPLADGWSGDQVRRVTLSDGGGVSVTLEPMKTDSPERLDEMALLVAEHGWEQLGGPWADQ